MATAESNSRIDASNMIAPKHESVARLHQLLPLLLISISAATGCTAMSDTDSPNNDSFRDQQSMADANTQIGRWITPGMTVAEAMETLESRGFACQPAMPQAEDVRSSIFCIYQTPSPPPPEQRIVAPQAPVNWIVTLDSKDGTVVSNLSLSRSPSHLGE